MKDDLYSADEPVRSGGSRDKLARAGVLPSLRVPRLLTVALAVIASSLSAAAAQEHSKASSFAFQVHVTYSAKAARTLRARREGVVASASYYGDPTRAGASHVNEVGQIDVGQERVTRPGAAPVFPLTGSTVQPRALRWVRGGRVEVNVNVFSARRSGPDNILDCTFFQDDIAVARTRPVRLHCKLIGET